LNNAPLVAGVDAAKGGWVMATTATTPGSPVAFSVYPTFAAVWAETRSQRLLAIGIDMPIGLPGKDLRRSDIEARELLGPRRSSLFWTPPLCVLHAADHAEANHQARAHTGRGLSIQSFHLLPKVREVRAELTPKDLAPHAEPRAAEVHPETSFAVLAGRPMNTPKRQQAGQAERLAVLVPEFSNLAEAPAPVPGATTDDLLDAAAAAWTARRMAVGKARVLGQGEVDATRYPMAILA
jgi:predicted RNase H-like nuclease